MQGSNPDGPVNYSGSYTSKKNTIIEVWRSRNGDS